MKPLVYIGSFHVAFPDDNPEDDFVSITSASGTSSASIYMTRENALALAEAITQNVKEPAHA